jgi:hypothetical protein
VNERLLTAAEVAMGRVVTFTDQLGPDIEQLALFDENLVPSDEWDAWFWNLPLSPSDEHGQRAEP